MTEHCPQDLLKNLGPPVLVDFAKERKRRRQDRGNGFPVVVVVVASDMSIPPADLQVADTSQSVGQNVKSVFSDHNHTKENRPAPGNRCADNDGSATPHSGKSWSLTLNGVYRTVKHVFHRNRNEKLSNPDGEDQPKSSRDANNEDPVMPHNVAPSEADNKRHSCVDTAGTASSPEGEKRSMVFQPSVYRANKRRKQTTLANIWFGWSAP